MLRYSFWGRSSDRIAEVLFIVVGTDHNIRGATSINIEFVLTLINVHLVWILSFLSLILIVILSNSISLYHKVQLYSHKIFRSPVAFDFIPKIVFKFLNNKISHIPSVGVTTRFVVNWIKFRLGIRSVFGVISWMSNVLIFFHIGLWSFEALTNVSPLSTETWT